MKLREHFEEVGESAGMMAIDGVFLAAWLAIEFVIERFVVPAFQVHDFVIGVCILCCRITFAVTTGSLAIGWALRDCAIANRRNWIAFKQERLKVRETASGEGE
jgi:hypothetical protein